MNLTAGLSKEQIKLKLSYMTIRGKCRDWRSQNIYKMFPKTKYLFIESITNLPGHMYFDKTYHYLKIIIITVFCLNIDM